LIISYVVDIDTLSILASVASNILQPLVDGKEDIRCEQKVVDYKNT